MAGSVTGKAATTRWIQRAEQPKRGSSEAEREFLNGQLTIIDEALRRSASLPERGFKRQAMITKKWIKLYDEYLRGKRVYVPTGPFAGRHEPRNGEELLRS